MEDSKKIQYNFVTELTSMVVVVKKKKHIIEATTETEEGEAEEVSVEPEDMTILYVFAMAAFSAKPHTITTNRRINNIGEL